MESTRLTPIFISISPHDVLSQHPLNVGILQNGQRVTKRDLLHQSSFLLSVRYLLDSDTSLFNLHNMNKSSLEKKPLYVALRHVVDSVIAFEAALNDIPSDHKPKEGDNIRDYPFHRGAMIAAEDVIKCCCDNGIGLSTATLFDFGILEKDLQIMLRPIEAYKFLVNVAHTQIARDSDVEYCIEPKLMFTFPIVWEPKSAFVIKGRLAPILDRTIKLFDPTLRSKIDA